MTRPRVQISAEALYFVTGNADKIREAQHVLSDVSQYELDTTEIQSLNEEAIIRDKLSQAKAHLDEPLFVEDVSLRLEALGGLPGPFIKYFLKRLSLQEVADLAAGPAQVRCTIGYWDGEEDHVFQAVVDGAIVQPRGEDWGFNPIFEHESGETYAQMSTDKRLRIGHRAQALKQLAAHIDKT